MQLVSVKLLHKFPLGGNPFSLEASKSKIYNVLRKDKNSDLAKICSIIVKYV
jgi:hypothetical protein